MGNNRKGRNLDQHYNQIKKDDCVKFNKNKIDTHQRFILKVQKTETCWLWIPSITSKSRIGGTTPNFHVNMIVRSIKARNYSFEYYKEKIKENHIVSYLCGDKNCVNPDHLIQETIEELNKRTNGNCWVGLRNICTKCGRKLEYLRGEKFRGCQKCYDEYNKKYGKENLDKNRKRVSKSYVKNREKRREEGRKHYNEKYKFIILEKKKDPVYLEHTRRIKREHQRKRRAKDRLKNNL